MYKQVKEILSRPYHWVLLPEVNDETGEIGWVAYIEEFPGCCTCGDTKEQALANLKDCAEVRLYATLEQPELTIPEPIQDWDEETLHKVNCRVKHHHFDKLVGEK